MIGYDRREIYSKIVAILKTSKSFKKVWEQSVYVETVIYQQLSVLGKNAFLVWIRKSTIKLKHASCVKSSFMSSQEVESYEFGFKKSNYLAHSMWIWRLHKVIQAPVSTYSISTSWSKLFK